MIELSLDGKILRYIRLALPTGARIEGLSYTASGQLFTWINGTRGALHVLDSIAGQWKHVSDPLDYWGLYGSDGENIIMATAGAGFSRIFAWIDPSNLNE